jgi:hypothetical protein
MELEIEDEEMVVPVSTGRTIFDVKTQKRVPEVFYCKVLEQSQFINRALKYAFSNGVPKHLYKENLEQIYDTMISNYHITHYGDKPAAMQMLRNSIKAVYEMVNK